MTQVVDTNYHTQWQTVQIQISWLPMYTVSKGRVYPGSARPRLTFSSSLWGFVITVLNKDDLQTKLLNTNQTGWMSKLTICCKFFFIAFVQGFKLHSHVPFCLQWKFHRLQCIRTFVRKLIATYAHLIMVFARGLVEQDYLMIILRLFSQFLQKKPTKIYIAGTH